MPDFFTRLAERTLARALTVQPVMASMFVPESNLVEQHIFVEEEDISVPSRDGSGHTVLQTALPVDRASRGPLHPWTHQTDSTAAVQAMLDRGETLAAASRVHTLPPHQDDTSAQSIPPNLHQSNEKLMNVRRGEGGVERLGKKDTGYLYKALWSPAGGDRSDGPPPAGGALWTHPFNTAGDEPGTDPGVPTGNGTSLPPLENVVGADLSRPSPIYRPGTQTFISIEDGQPNDLSVPPGNQIASPSREDTARTGLIPPSNILLVEQQPGTASITRNDATQPAPSSVGARFIVSPSPTPNDPSQLSKTANASIGADVSHSSPTYRLETVVETSSGRKVTHTEAHHLGTSASEMPLTTPAPTISVTIGRIEVRAMPPTTPAAQPHKQHTRSPVMSLDEYLRKPSKGGH